MNMMDDDTQFAFSRMFTLAGYLSENPTYIAPSRRRLLGMAGLLLLTVFGSCLLCVGYLRYFIAFIWIFILYYYFLFRTVWRGNGYSALLLDAVMSGASVLSFFAARGLLRLLDAALEGFGISLPL